MKTSFKYYWEDDFNHCIAVETVSDKAVRYRHVSAVGTTWDGINEARTSSELDAAFWASAVRVYRITRAQFRKYLKTGETPAKA